MSNLIPSFVKNTLESLCADIHIYDVATKYYLIARAMRPGEGVSNLPKCILPICAWMAINRKGKKPGPFLKRAQEKSRYKPTEFIDQLTSVHTLIIEAHKSASNIARTHLLTDSPSAPVFPTPCGYCSNSQASCLTLKGSTKCVACYLQKKACNNSRGSGDKRVRGQVLIPGSDEDEDEEDDTIVPDTVGVGCLSTISRNEPPLAINPPKPSSPSSSVHKSALHSPSDVTNQNTSKEPLQATPSKSSSSPSRARFGPSQTQPRPLFPKQATLPNFTRRKLGDPSFPSNARTSVKQEPSPSFPQSPFQKGQGMPTRMQAVVADPNPEPKKALGKRPAPEQAHWPLTAKKPRPTDEVASSAGPNHGVDEQRARRRNVVPNTGAAQKPSRPCVQTDYQEIPPPHPAASASASASTFGPKQEIQPLAMASLPSPPSSARRHGASVHQHRSPPASYTPSSPSSYFCQHTPLTPTNMHRPPTPSSLRTLSPEELREPHAVEPVILAPSSTPAPVTHAEHDKSLSFEAILRAEIQDLAEKTIEHVHKKGCGDQILELHVRDLETRMELRAKYASRKNLAAEEEQRANEQLNKLDKMILEKLDDIILYMKEHELEDIDVDLKVRILDLGTRRDSSWRVDRGAIKTGVD